jgi:hypothetical protein
MQRVISTGLGAPLVQQDKYHFVRIESSLCRDCVLYGKLFFREYVLLEGRECASGNLYVP